MSAPLVTIGVVSYNRLHYLRALMESARECAQYPRVQWILVDGNSVEPGLRACRGILAAERVVKQARTLAEGRGLGWTEVELATLRGDREPELTLFGF